MRQKIAIVFGTRPEIVKFAPLIKELRRRKLKFFVINTNQHFSKNMSGTYVHDLGLPKIAYNLHLASASKPFSIPKATRAIRKVLQKEKPTTVLVQGDTASALSGALAASKERVQLGHVEAGLRSSDMRTTEERYARRITTLADLHFAPSIQAVRNLTNEGVTRNVQWVGNTIIDAVIQNGKGNRAAVLRTFGVKSKAFVLFSAHKHDVVDSARNLRSLVRLVGRITTLGVPVIFMVHPRTRQRLSKNQISLSTRSDVHIVSPQRYATFLALEKNALAVVTDSAGAQEECSKLGTPCLVLKQTTQRPEVVTHGSAILCGLDAEKIVDELTTLIRHKRRYAPFRALGDGTASRKIITALCKART